jgi:hypothetical protein
LEGKSMCDHKHCWRNFLLCMNDWWTRQEGM